MTVEDVQRRLARTPARPTTTRRTRSCARCSTSDRLGAFSNGDRELFRPIVEHLLGPDTYMLLADYRATRLARRRSAACGATPSAGPLSILNVARMGRFSSDRSISEYCRNIWHVKPVPIRISHAAESGATRTPAAAPRPGFGGRMVLSASRRRPATTSVPGLRPFNRQESVRCNR